MFVEIEEGIEGLVHVSEISREKIKNPEEKYKVGDSITAKVMNINSDERRIGLSIKRLEQEEDPDALADYNAGAKESTSAFEKLSAKLTRQKKVRNNSF